MDVKFVNITQALEIEVFQVGQPVQLYLQLYYIIQAIVRTVWQAHSYVEHVVTIENAFIGTPFIISHYPMKFEGFAIRNKESFTRVFKDTI